MKNKSIFKDILEVIILVLIFMGIYYSLFNFVFSNDTVSGPSMQPNFESNDRVITVRHSDIHRGDIVVIKAPDQPNALYIKRVIGMPGDTISFKNDQLYINGKKQNEPYLDSGKKLYSMGQIYTNNFSLKSRGLGNKVPKNSYFVMGDHRNVSNDSRMFGYVKRSGVIGVVKLRYWPLNKITWY
ncbi:signal peptidase I [Lactobacillus sp. PSON]|uniref:signal peptidase I n=1 Tax=Lactobacillus sp. PSON TaxID=3455454 RepID=UPI004040F33A